MTSFLTSLPPSLLKKKSRSPEHLSNNAKSSLIYFISNWQSATPETEKLQSELENLGRCLLDLKNIFYGEPFPGSANPPILHSLDGKSSDLRLQQEEEVIKDASRSLLQSGLLLLLINNFKLVPFESRKNTALIFNCLMKNYDPFPSHIAEPNNILIINQLVDGYTDSDIALGCGSMIRECIKYDQLALYILNSDLFMRFFDEFVSLPNFDVASDAFSTLKYLLTLPHNPEISSEFIESNYEAVFSKYEQFLLQSENFVTKRRSIVLLSEILRERSNYNVMIRYISSKNNLKTIMTLLRDTSSSIQYETFQVFKLFVANPNKSAEVKGVLVTNKLKLIEYLKKFHLDKKEPQFVDEKRLLIDALESEK
mmetsp:Transcript_26880/g.37051  ORF Transcript_26880/g.37051 Transcript_26880/m.37051 type:complete len:368 (-) Transcript_26880:1254-2357(-)